MNLLITGGAGFIGSNFVLYILSRFEDVNVINLDKLTYAGSLDNLKEVENHPRHIFIQGDICNSELVNHIFSRYNIDGVIHFAAESHVDNSIENPMAFIDTNINGTAVVLEAARSHWMNSNGSYKDEYKHARFHHVSTDEVYGSLDSKGFFTEKTPYAPNSPYSASKASSDMIVRSYFHTFNFNVVTTNCSNNFGPKQHKEKLIPNIIQKAISFQNIPIYGDGKNVRDWLYVIDHCRAIEKVFIEGKEGETYLIGGHNEQTNIDVAYAVCGILNDLKPIKSSGIIEKYEQLISFVDDRAGHDFRYAIDDRKIRNELNFQIKPDFRRHLIKTVKYYLDN